FRQVSWLAGRHPSQAFPDFARQNPVAFERRIRRRQLRGQLRTCHCRWNGVAHRIPSWLINAISTPELHGLNKRVRRGSSKGSDFSIGVARAPRENEPESKQPLLAATPRRAGRRAELGNANKN